MATAHCDTSSDFKDARHKISAYGLCWWEDSVVGSTVNEMQEKGFRMDALEILDLCRRYTIDQHVCA